MCLGVSVAFVAQQAAADEGIQVSVLFAVRGHRHGSPSAWRKVGQVSREQGGAVRLQERLFQHALQLPDVSWPAVVAQALHRFRGDIAAPPAPAYG